MSDEKEILTTANVADHFNDKHRTNLGRRGPMGVFLSTGPEQALDDLIKSRPGPVAAQKATAYRALSWQQRNKIIEGQRRPEPEFDVKAFRERRGY